MEDVQKVLADVVDGVQGLIKGVLDDKGALIVIGVIGILAVLAVVCMTDIKRTEKVKDTSVLLKELNRLNRGTYFYLCNGEYTQSREMPSKAAYDRYSCDQLRDEILLDPDDSIHRLLEQIKENREQYDIYVSQVGQLQSMITEDEAKRLKVSYKKYLEIEKALFEEQKLKPALDMELICVVKYTSPAGRNHYEKSYAYSYVDVLLRLQELQETVKQRETEEYKRKVERSKVTPKLRLAVIERDGRRCQICGARQEDGVTLHVDHIIPVAKGGKTEMSNLRTLCDMCNQGKSDQILENDFYNITDKD